MSQFRISSKAVKNAEASRSFLLAIPAHVKPTTSKKNEQYWRWTEQFEIVKAERENIRAKDQNGERTGPMRTQFFLELKVRDTDSDNAQKSIYSRHLINFGALNGGGTTDKVLNNMSVRVVKTLVEALGFELEVDEDGGTAIPGEFFEGAFPEKDSGDDSNIVGMSVDAVIVDSPNVYQGKVTRQQQCEEYLPAL